MIEPKNDSVAELKWRLIALITGPTLFVMSVLFATKIFAELPQNAAVVAGLTLWMGLWWVTECLPIPMTSLLPLAILPLFDIQPSKAISVAYAHQVNLLLLGGFMLAKAVEKWNLHERVALHIVLTVGNQPAFILLGFMIATSASSMWISNTATTLMIIPIALACVQFGLSDNPQKLATPFVLGIAYSASVGGLATPIGTPPNLICIAQFNDSVKSANTALNGSALTFVEWMAFGLPIVVVLIPLIWLYLCWQFNLWAASGGSSSDYLRNRLTQLGRASREEKLAAFLFAVTAVLWITKAPLSLGWFEFPGWACLFVKNPSTIHDATIAVFMVCVMGLVPVEQEDPSKPPERLLDWNTANSIPWGLLLLFGGGLALAGAFKASGLSVWLGDQLSGLSSLPTSLMLATLVFSTLFATEITSNTAVAALIMPILANLAPAIGVSPKLLMIPTALAASCAFMFPVATAPNAIAYGTGAVSIKQMARTGLVLNILAGLVLSTAGYLFLSAH